jgi:ribosomal protein S18 acetylase RimI-like enzyme
MIDSQAIKLIEIVDSNRITKDFELIYEEAFPPDERREWSQLIDLLNNPDFSFIGIYFQQQIIGFMMIWNLHEFSFIEHFAIRESERGKGIGKQAIEKILAQILTPVILEVEIPKTEAAQKRIRFYERLNFSICEGEYFQPPYSAGKNKVEMLLMSYHEKMLNTTFGQIKTIIYSSVYQFPE